MADLFGGDLFHALVRLYGAGSFHARGALEIAAQYDAFWIFPLRGLYMFCGAEDGYGRDTVGRGYVHRAAVARYEEVQPRYQAAKLRNSRFACKIGDVFYPFLAYHPLYVAGYVRFAGTAEDDYVELIGEIRGYFGELFRVPSLRAAVCGAGVYAQGRALEISFGPV